MRRKSCAVSCRRGELNLLSRLLSSQKTDAPRKCPMLCPAESQKLRRVHVVIDRRRVPPVGHVVEARAQCQPVSEQVEAPLDVRVQRKISGEAELVWRPDELLPLVHQTERVAAAPVERV